MSLHFRVLQWKRGKKKKKGGGAGKGDGNKKEEKIMHVQTDLFILKLG